MKRNLLAFWLLLLSFPAMANVPCSLPFNLANGTIADATQVMANYNALVACLGNAAAAGNNSDITALLGLTTPISPVFGGTTTFLGGTASGTNSIVVSGTTPSNFVLNTNYKVRFIAGGANSGPTQLTVSPTGIQNFYRQTQFGPQPMVGGEIVSGQSVEADWDGTEYQMTSQPAIGHMPGEVFDFAGPNGCPTGSIEANGGQFSQTNYSTLYFSAIGNTWGVPVGGNGILPDLRGRTTFDRDSGGSGRITVAGGNFDGTTVGNTGGVQSNVVNRANLAAMNFTVSGIVASANINGCGLNQGGCGTAGSDAALSVNGSNTTISGQGVNFSSQGSAASSGSGTPLPTLSNAAIVIKCVKG